MLLQDLQDESPFHLSAPLVIVFGQIEMMLWVGSSGLRMFCTKKSSSPVRPINSLRVSVGGWEPCESAFLTKGIVSTSLVVRFKAKVDDFLFEVFRRVSPTKSDSLVTVFVVQEIPASRGREER